MSTLRIYLAAAGKVSAPAPKKLLIGVPALVFTPVSIKDLCSTTISCFFATTGADLDAMQSGDVSSSIGLFDNGTAVNQYPGAGITQFNLAGTPLEDSKDIMSVKDVNEFTMLPAVSNIIKVTLQ